MGRTFWVFGAKSFKPVCDTWYRLDLRSVTPAATPVLITAHGLVTFSQSSGTEPLSSLTVTNIPWA